MYMYMFSLVLCTYIKTKSAGSRKEREDVMKSLDLGCYRFYLLRFVVLNRGDNGVFSQHGTVQFNGRKFQVGCDVSVL